MKMRLNLFLIAISLILISPAALLAWHDKRPVTPYGDFSPRCTHYGICNKPMSHDDARKAMIDYYHKKGYVVELERKQPRKRGRFIRARIKDENGVVDVIIFDRRTGRIRSIY